MMDDDSCYDEAFGPGNPHVRAVVLSEWIDEMAFVEDDWDPLKSVLSWQEKERRRHRHRRKCEFCGYIALDPSGLIRHQRDDRCQTQMVERVHVALQRRLDPSGIIVESWKKSWKLALRE